MKDYALSGIWMALILILWCLLSIAKSLAVLAG